MSFPPQILRVNAPPPPNFKSGNKKGGGGRLKKKGEKGKISKKLSNFPNLYISVILGGGKKKYRANVSKSYVQNKTGIGFKCI